MEILKNNNNKIICISIKDAMSGALTPDDEKNIRDLLEEDNPLLIFDLSSLEYLGSASLRAILDAARRIKSKQGKVVLCCPNRYVREIFEVSGFGALIPMADSVESGLNVDSHYSS